ncbi:phenylacetate--CoA ligase family protein [Rhizobium sp. Root1220]|uniref:phenylacetate--CoA ligase family protein n=1 Tax=Rhizobium sp. Root1220 TaxID=1736432 RepID=UPI0006F88915|nr:phenylacetate--CoA ligase family protein [Rhizobium sp. Root1220]KQV79265.1 CoF synthetase [Rhizobium sp. Root1220]
MLAFQSDRLKATLRHAATSSLYYRGSIGDLVSRDASLEGFPVLTKRMLMQNFDRIVTDVRLSRRLVEDHLSGDDPGSPLLGEYRVAATGGTTGEKGLAVFGGPAWLDAIANTLRFQTIVGIDETTRSIAIFASSPVHISHRIGAELRAFRPPAPKLNVLMPIEDIVETLNKHQPEVISTYPSFVRVLAKEQAAGRLRIRPRFVRTSAETLTADVKEIVTAAWGATAANSYTCTEAGAMGHECLFASGLHLAEDAFLFEVVDGDNRRVPNGTAGAKLLVTTLTNRALPLVRYEISDIVTLATEPCGCGLPFWRIAAIDGHREEVLEFLGRRGETIAVHAHRLRSPLTGAKGVRQFQFRQLSDGLEITISVFPEFDRETVASEVEIAVRSTLEAVGARPERVAVRTVYLIGRSGSGAKEKLVIRENEPGEHLHPET